MRTSTLAIAVTGGLAAVSMWFALTSAARINPFWSAALALLWAVAVMSIERWLVTPAVTTSRISSAVTASRTRFVRLGILRLLLALALGVVISIPLVLWIFQPEISRQVTVTRQQHVNQLSTQLDQASQRSVQWNARVASLNKVIDANNPVNYNSALAALIEQQTNVAEKVRQAYQCEVSGKSQDCPTGSKGELKSYNDAQAQLGALATAISSQASQLSSAEAAKLARYQQAAASLPAARRQQDAALAHEKALRENLAALNEPGNDVGSRLQAVAQLFDDNAAVGLGMTLTFLLLVLIGSSPVSGKMLQPAMSAGPGRGAGRSQGLGAMSQSMSQTIARGSAVVTPRSRPAETPSSGASPARRRYLKGQCPDTVQVGKPFSLLASIMLANPDDDGKKLLEPFEVPPEGQAVLLVLNAPGLRLLGDHRLIVHVPSDRGSRPVMFELRADAPGPRKISITAWLGGNYLGELLVEITAERGSASAPHQEVLAEIGTDGVEGAVSLVVRYDPVQQAYRFEFRDEDNPAEVRSELAYDPGPLVEQLIADLDDLAKGRSGYSAAQAHDYLMNAGARLWRQLVPGPLREQFWERQHRIRQLTILADKDAVPWELLYPMDPGRDAGFLVQQFPVTRAIFGWRPARSLHLQPARFVLPQGSLPGARDEIDTMRRLLEPGQRPGNVIDALTPLTELIGGGDFGLLHFACHNTYDPARGSSIRLGSAQFTPTSLERAVIQKTLSRTGPTVFINACRSAGLAATYNRLDSWASQFLEAGAAAFIGSLWAVSDGTACEFAQELYRHLQTGSPLGNAVMQARQAAASQADDPTWLAYTAYGDPRATVDPQS